jgi:hypothetical protein
MAEKKDRDQKKVDIARQLGKAAGNIVNKQIDRVVDNKNKRDNRRNEK